MEAKFGGTRTFGLYDDQMAQYGKVLFYHLWEFAVFIVMGVNGGLLGVAFIWLNKKLTLWRYKYELCSCAYSRIRTFKPLLRRLWTFLSLNGTVMMIALVPH
jgi:H+/Cl- antiporter ClcA